MGRCRVQRTHEPSTFDFNAAGWLNIGGQFRVTGFGDTPFGPGDFPTFHGTGVPAMSGRAWSTLCSLIDSRVEALPLVHDDGELYAVNVLDMIDCLDEERSELARNKATNRVNHVYKYCIRMGMLKGKHIFKTPLKSGAEVFVDQDFRECVEENGLNGLLFRELPMV